MVWIRNDLFRIRIHRKNFGVPDITHVIEVLLLFFFFLNLTINQKEKSTNNYSPESSGLNIMKYSCYLMLKSLQLTLGMGNMYGPQDQELKLCEENTHKRTLVIEERLLPTLGKHQRGNSSQCCYSSDSNPTFCQLIFRVRIGIYFSKLK